MIQNLQKELKVAGEIRGSNKIFYTRLKYVLKSPTIEDLATRMDEFRLYIKQAWFTPKQTKLLKSFLLILPNATLHLSFDDPKVPRTTNKLENLNGQIKARLKTFRGVKSEDSLNNLLKILFKFRKYK
jgi:transposase-like protein